MLVAVASFGWLVYLMSRLYGTDDEAATSAMLAEYNRPRTVVRSAARGRPLEDSIHA